MNSPRSKSLYLVMFFIITGSCTQSYAGISDWFTGKRIASLAFVAAISRLVTKDVNEIDSTFSEEFNKLKSKPLTKEWFELAWSIFDDYVIGHPGKGRGLKISGSSVSFEGKQAPLGSYLNENDVEISLYGYKRIPASGALGITWSYLQEIVKGLKFVKEVDDMGTSFGVINERLFSTK